MTHGATIPGSALQLGMFMCAVQNNIKKATEVITPQITPHVFKQFVNCVLIWLKVLTPGLVWVAKQTIQLKTTLPQRAGTENVKINDKNDVQIFIVMEVGWEQTGTGFWSSW